MEQSILTNRTNLASLAATALVCAVGGSSSLSAQEAPPGSEIVVRGNALRPWIEQVDNQLSRLLAFPVFKPGKDDTDRGIVIISFMRGDDGRSSQVALRKGSGNHALDRKAMDAVRQLKLPEMPGGFSPQQPMLANIVFDTDVDSPYYLQAIKAQSEAEERLMKRRGQ